MNADEKKKYNNAINEERTMIHAAQRQMLMTENKSIKKVKGVKKV